MQYLDQIEFSNNRIWKYRKSETEHALYFFSEDYFDRMEAEIAEYLQRCKQKSSHQIKDKAFLGKMRRDMKVAKQLLRIIPPSFSINSQVQSDLVKLDRSIEKIDELIESDNSLSFLSLPTELYDRTVKSLKLKKMCT